MKKIMFNDKFALTEAVLEGRKTMTRRILDYEKYKKTWDDMCRLGNPCFDTFDDFLIKRKAQYKIGEVVAVAQNYHDVYEELKRTHGSSSRVTREFFHKYVQGGRMPVSNKMFVRADLMPHQIKITDVKVERLQDISEEDCLREGVVKHTPFPIDENKPRFAYKVNKQGLAFEWFCTPQNAFAALIDKVSGKGTWNSNPYVFAYTFELVR